MKKNILLYIVSLVMFFYTSIANASLNTLQEVSCSRYDLPTKDQCFLGERIYVGNSILDLADSFNNKWNIPLFLFVGQDAWWRDLASKVNIEFLQWATWYKPKNFINLNPERKFNERFAHEIQPGSSKVFIRNEEWSTLTLASVSNQTNYNKPVIKLTYETNAFNGKINPTSGSWIPDKDNFTKHFEHAFYYASWCGDWVVDSQYGEKFDDGTNNGKPGFASTDCQTKTPELPKPVHGICSGASNNIPTFTAPANLCTSGAPSVVTDHGDRFTWSCGGVNGGNNISCEAPKKINAICGPNNNTIVTTKPTTNLCTVGNPTAVTGNNPYSWTCQGINGGDSVSCKTNPPPVTPNPADLKCDQTFHGKLRYYGPNQLYQYDFADLYTNSNSYPHTLKSFNADFKESDDMNKDGKLTFNNFKWATNNLTIPAGTKDLKVVSADPKYQLLTTPSRRQEKNIYIEYTINGRGQADFSHKECISWEVTWCGDGVVDNYTDHKGEKITEICDPNDPNKTNWGPNGCNPQGTKDPSGKDVSCTPKTTPQNPTIEIKKYVKNINNVGDSQDTAVTVAKGETFNYYYVFENKESFAINNVAFVDTFPAHLTFAGEPRVTDKNNIDVTSDFTFHKGKISQNSLEHITLKGFKKTPLVANSGKYTVTIPVKIANNVDANISLQNMVYICADGVKITDNSGKNICETVTTPDCRTNVNDPKCVPTVPPTQCTPENNPYKDPACITVDGGSELKIKKYAGNKDGQNSNDALSVNIGEDFTYTYNVTVSGSTDQNNVTVTDRFPQGVIVTGFKTIPQGWTCKNGTITDSGRTYSTVVCQTANMKANTTVSIVVNSKLTSAENTLPKRNIAYVCSTETTGTNVNNTPACNPTCTDPTNPSCTPNRDPGICSDIPSHPNYDPACIVPQKSLDLSIKKYIDSDDAQTAISKSTSSTFNYRMIVKVESGTATGTTTVKDVLPAGIEPTSSASGSNWTCNINNRTLTCTTTQTVNEGGYFPEIILPVKVTASAGTEVRNDATVHNPNENPNTSCHANNGNITGNEKSCEKDPKNTDPAIFRVPGNNGGGSSSSTWKTIMCVGSNVEIKSYPSQALCTFDWQNTDSNKRYSKGCLEAAGETDNLLNSERSQIQASCKTTPSTPTGPGGGWNWGWSGGWYCGDGRIQGNESCDNGHLNWTIGNSCNIYCKVDTKTNPGENPTHYKIQIPTLSKLSIGTTPGYNYITKNINDYKLVIGKNSKLFTLNDKIILNMEQQFDNPRSVAVETQFNLESSNSAIISWSANSNINNYKGNNYYWKSPKGNVFVILGKGDFIVPTGSVVYNKNNSEIQPEKIGSKFNLYRISDNNNEVALFNGVALNEIKSTNNIGDTNISLKTNWNELVKMTVKVINSTVSSSSTFNNSKLEKFTIFNGLNDYLNSIKKTTSITASSNNNSSDLFNSNFGKNISINGAKSANPTISKLDDLNSYKLNGNENVFAIKGNVTIENCTNKTFQMSGVKTLIVEGNLTFKCNTSFDNNNSSWAFIAKGENIVIDKDVTNLAGVFVAVEGGKIIGTDATANILRIDGTLYGNADDLFKSRTYARGNDAYNMVTSGTIMSYSNRALRNPPPMLSNYLSNYNIQRVVR